MKNKKNAVLLLLLQIGALPLAAENQLSAQQAVERMATRADEMDLAAEEWGYWRESVEKKLDSKNRIEEEKKKLRRTIWLEGMPYMELVKVNDKDLDTAEQKEEAERKAKFAKAMKDPPKKDSEDDDPTWKQLIQKYDYSLLSSDGKTAYLVSFRPKKSGVAERNRADKIFNNLTGKLWIDEDFHLIRATASLTEGLRFGLGLVAKLEKLDIDYRWQQYEKIWLPSNLDFQMNARLMVFKSIRQKVNMRFFDPFQRPSN